MMSFPSCLENLKEVITRKKYSRLEKNEVKKNKKLISFDLLILNWYIGSGKKVGGNVTIASGII